MEIKSKDFKKRKSTENKIKTNIHVFIMQN